VGAHPERAYVNSTYLQAVQQAGGVPVALPPQLSPASMRRLTDDLDGLLLTGGGDVDPALFDEAPHATLYDVAPSRDTLETAVLHLALERGRPVLAVCRGLQVLNVALGGSLYQDVGADPGTQIPHSQKEPRDQPTHKVTVTPGSRLAETLGADELEVNSMHHQAIRRLGRGLTAVAWAPDQLVEGAELDDPARFVLGVQWHPEELVGHSEPARRLFAALVAAARKS
jgi:putative glutamine amidotransferase